MSLHEIYVQTNTDESSLKGLLTPMVFESLSTEAGYNKEFTF